LGVILKENPVHCGKMVLAIETSGRIGSAALGRGDTVLADCTFSGFMKQGAELFPRIRTMLDTVGGRPCVAAMNGVFFQNYSQKLILGREIYRLFKVKTSY
jgi:hypothetical protein